MEIWRDAVDATHDFLTLEDRAAIEQEVRRFLPTAPLWLAVNRDDRAIGFMLLDGPHIEALFIDPLHRGTGIGWTLVAHALTFHPALTTRCERAELPGRRFLQAHRFTQTGRSSTDGQGRSYPLVHLQLSPVVVAPDLIFPGDRGYRPPADSARSPGYGARPWLSMTLRGR
jgi:putative acetyltransferase